MIKKRKVWYLLFISAMILTWVHTNVAYSQSSTNYTIPWSVLDGGGGIRSSVNYTLMHSIGQTAGVGTASSSQYTNFAGFYGSEAQGGADIDGDGIPNGQDNCPVNPNSDQKDSDEDGLGDVCDACPNDPDNDSDGDGVCGDVDNCPNTPNPGQEDTDGDGIGDACESTTDADGDGVPDGTDNCPNTPNTDQKDTDNDGLGDACDTCPNDPDNDSDGDGICGDVDNCPNTSNPEQEDSDGDGIGDACESIIDADGDGIPDNTDNCPNTPNTGQEDSDGDGIGDACESDADDDGIPDDTDNCPNTPNPDQADTDGDGIGDACEDPFTSSYFGYDEFGGTWQDADKSLTNPDDDWMCWAAAAANILDWAGWETPLFDSAMDIFYTFQNYWTNAPSLMQYAWHWWFDGTEPPDWAGWSQVDVPGGGDYWSEYDFFEYFYEDWALAPSGQWFDEGFGLMATIDEYLHSGYGTTLAIYADYGELYVGHALTVWGYEYDEFGNYTGLWVTDSDDYTNELIFLSVWQDLDGLWYLSGNGYDDYFIGGVQALDRNPIPEPTTLIFLIVGLLGVFAFVRRRRKMRK